MEIYLRLCEVDCLHIWLDRCSNDSTHWGNGAGYHQAPLDETSRAYTAFRTNHGLYLICKVYIDDELIDGADEDTFVNNVRQAFDRFRSHEMIVKKLGLEQVNYVGHLVSHEGLSCTTVKRHKINDFERPRAHKGMLMYVGLVNYIHGHRMEHEWPLGQPIQKLSPKLPIGVKFDKVTLASKYDGE